MTLYGELLCRRVDWAGKLVLAAFHGAAWSGLSAAASLAGAASLTVDEDGAGVKASFRDGAFDFVVNTLDEALRAMKNEIRQGRPIAIGLIAEPSAVLAEAEERGVVADFVLDEAGIPSTEFADWLAEQGWSAQGLAGSGELAEEGGLRGRWLRDLPLYQRSVRHGERWVWLSKDEIA